MACVSAQKGRNHGKYEARIATISRKKSQFSQSLDSPVRVSFAVRKLDRERGLRQGLHGIMHGTVAWPTHVDIPRNPTGFGPGAVQNQRQRLLLMGGSRRGPS